MAGENAGQLALEALADCEEILTEAIKPGILRGDMVFIAQAKARRVLARPKRNCDVGTATEQYERFRRFCLHYHQPGGGCYNRADDMDCPLRHKDGDCTLNWSQLPYKQGELHGNPQQVQN